MSRLFLDEGTNEPTKSRHQAELKYFFNGAPRRRLGPKSSLNRLGSWDFLSANAIRPKPTHPFQEIAGLIKGLLTTLGLALLAPYFLGWFGFAPRIHPMIGEFHAPGTKVSTAEWTKSTVWSRL